MGKTSSSSAHGDFSSALGAGAGIGLGHSLGNAGGLMVCNAQNQDTTYCKFVQYFNLFKMFLFILFVVGLIGYLIYLFSPLKALKKKRGGGVGR